MTAPYGSPARILAFGGVPGAVHCGDEAHVFLDDRAVARDVIAKADAVGLDVDVVHASAAEKAEHGGEIKLVVTIRPEPPMQLRTSTRRMCDVMRPDLDAGLAEVAMAWPRSAQ
jgi:hypothetical protein